MALLLSRIYEFRSGELAKGLKHVLVIEEAHRLLAKPPQTGEYSANSRGKSVEVFSDMLAEIRAYGQGIVIADQIPAKLIPDVIKNTDIKIVHRLMAKEDREAVGTAMNLTERQINDLNRATPGLATVSFDGLNSAIRVQIRNVPLQIVSGEESPAAVRIEAMTKYKRNVFLKHGDQSAQCPVVNAKSIERSWLILRLFFVALICEKTDPLVKLRYEIEREDATNGYKPMIDKNDLWPCVADGAHMFLNDLVANGMPSGDAGVLVSALVAFARPWSQKEAFKKEMEPFILLAKKDIDFSDRSKATQIDFFSFVLQMYADKTDFQDKVKESLRASSISDWTPLQQVLLEYVKDLTVNTIEQTDTVAKIKLMLRMIRCIKDADEDLAKKAGLAYHSLIQLLPGQNTTVVTQEWEEKENND